MRRTIACIAFIGLIVALNVTAADPPYVGRWKVNEDKSDFGSVITFSRNASGELRFIQGDVNYVMHLDGSELPHPLGGVVSWQQVDDRTWSTRLRKDGKVIGEATFVVSADGKTMTSIPADGQGSTQYRRTSGESSGLVGVWSLRTAAMAIMEIEVADGYDLVIRSGPVACKANFDGKDYPNLGPDGKPTTWSTCAIARTGTRGFSFTINVNGRPYAIATRTVSDDGRTLIEVGGLVGKPPNSRIVWERQ